jgi:hypothetical protein
MTTTTGKIPQDIVDAIKNGIPLTDDQLRRMIEAEAEMIGLTFDEAIELGRRRALPKSIIGMDLQSLIYMLLTKPGLKEDTSAVDGN